MSQALAALLGAIATAAACYALGALLIDRFNPKLYRAERFPLALLLGAACLHLAIFALLALHIGYWPVIMAALAAVMIAAAVKKSWRLRGESFKPLGKGARAVMILLFGAYTVLQFFHAWAPENSPDGSGYHLALVARYMRAHGFERITTSFYASLSQGLEMLFLPAFVIGRHSAAALLHWIFSLALAFLILAFGRRMGKPWAGIAAAFLTFASPVVGIDASSAYNDVAAAAVVFAAFYWLQLWDESRDDRLLIFVGLLGGYAYAIKYTAVLILPLALVFVAYRARKLKPLVWMAACATLMIAPWMIKNWVEVRNPLAPFANAIFPNPYMHLYEEQVLARMFRTYGITNKWTIPVEVIARGKVTNGLLGPIFFALPLALLALRNRTGRRLLAAGVVLMLAFPENIGTRFLIPSIPFFSLAMALPLASAPAALTTMMLFHAVSSWPPAVHRYAPNAWGLDKVVVREALRIVPMDKYMRSYDQSYGAARLVEFYVPKGERVLAINGIADSYTTREILVSYRSAWTQMLADALDAGYQADRQPRIGLTFSFPERNVRRIRVHQTADTTELWSVNELRFYDQRSELPRAPEWRLRAWPNPWEVQLAFDNSGPTRWRTWGPSTNAYIDTDFGKPVALDRVQIQTSYDYFFFKPTLEVMDDDGRWLEIARDPVRSDLPEDHNSRREAVDFIKSQGIHYLLIQDTDYESEDLRGDPEGWGLTRIASGYGVKIYRIE